MIAVLPEITASNHKYYRAGRLHLCKASVSRRHSGRCERRESSAICRPVPERVGDNRRTVQITSLVQLQRVLAKPPLAAVWLICCDEPLTER